MKPRADILHNFRKDLEQTMNLSQENINKIMIKAEFMLRGRDFEHDSHREAQMSLQRDAMINMTARNGLKARS